MTTWINALLCATVIGVLSIASTLATKTSGELNVAASERYLQIAQNLLKHQLSLENELHSAAVESCKGCDIEEEVCAFDYADVMALLEVSLTNYPKNAEANFLIGRVYWLKSYVGEGNYDRSHLLKAKQHLELATQFKINERYIKKLQYYLVDTDRALTGRYQPRRCE